MYFQLTANLIEVKVVSDTLWNSLIQHCSEHCSVFINECSSGVCIFLVGCNVLYLLIISSLFESSLSFLIFCLLDLNSFLDIHIKFFY